MKLDIVLSFFNEENVLAEFLHRSRSTLQRMVDDGLLDSYHLIFIDDASTDRSPSILQREMEAEDITVVTFASNTGVAEGVFAGLQISTADAVIYMDCDLQDPPEFIRTMVETWSNRREFIDIVHTKRSARDGESLLKRRITALGYQILAKSSYIDLEPEVGDFKLLSRRAVQLLLEHQEQLPFTRGLVAQTRLPSVTIDYRREPRFDGAENTHFPVLGRKTIRSHLNRSLIAFSDRPLKLLLKLGIVMFVVSTCYLLVVLAQKVTGLHEPGWPALMAAITLFGSLNMLGFGVLGLYINVIYLETKGRPAYTVSKVTSTRSLRLPDSARWPRATVTPDETDS